MSRLVYILFFGLLFLCVGLLLLTPLNIWYMNLFGQALQACSSSFQPYLLMSNAAIFVTGCIFGSCLFSRIKD